MVVQSMALRARASLFGDRNFRLVWASVTVSAFGFYVTDIAVPLFAVDQLNVTSFEAGLIRAFQQAPNLIFGLLLGVFVDRVRKRPLLIWSDVIRSLVLLAIPLAAFRDQLNLPLVCVVMFFVGTFNLLFDVAHQSFVPLVVTRDQMVDGNARMEASMATAQLGGPAIGGALVSVFTAPYAVLVTAITLLSSAGFIRRTKVAEPAARVSTGRSVRADIGDGIAFVRRHPIMRPILLVSMGHSFFGYMFLAVYILYMKRDLGISDLQVGLIFAAGGLGALIGTIATPALNRRFGIGATLVAGGLMFGVTGLLIPLAVLVPDHALPIVIVCEFLQYLCELPFFLNAITLVQTQSPDDMRGRVMSTRKVMTWGVQPFGSLLGGVLGGLITVPWTLAVAEFGLLSVGLWLCLNPIRQMRSIPYVEANPNVV
jgi:MFS family permease